MAIEGQITGSYESLKTQLANLDEIAEIAGELDNLLDEMKRTLEIVRLAMGEVEAPTGTILLKSS